MHFILFFVSVPWSNFEKAGKWSARIARVIISSSSELCWLLDARCYSDIREVQTSLWRLLVLLPAPQWCLTQWLASIILIRHWSYFFMWVEPHPVKFLLTPVFLGGLFSVMSLPTMEWTNCLSTVAGARHTSAIDRAPDTRQWLTPTNIPHTRAVEYILVSGQTSQKKQPRHVCLTWWVFK